MSETKRPTSMLEAVKAINNARKNQVLTSGSLIPECKRCSMGTMSADYALYGGIPEGKITQFAGESHSGKSLMALFCMAMYQKKYPDKVNVYIDAEETLVGQIEWMAQATGLDVNHNFLRYDCTGLSAEEIFDDIYDTMMPTEDIGMIIIDSAPALISKDELEAKISEDKGQRASIAKPLGRFTKKMVHALARRGNPMIIINHTRPAGKTYTGATIYTEPCGYALNFFPTIKVRFGKRTFTKGDKIDIPQSLIKKPEDSDGICLTFSVTKNKIGACDRSGGKIILRKDNYEGGAGVDLITDLFEIITTGKIARLDGNTWYLEDPYTRDPYIDEETGMPIKCGSRDKLKAYLREHPAFTKMYSEAVSNYINQTGSGVSLLSDAEIKAITDVDKSVDENLDKSEYDPDKDKNEEGDEK